MIQDVHQPAPRAKSDAEIVTLTGACFLRSLPPTVRLTIQPIDEPRYVLDGWDVLTVGRESMAERVLPILDGDIGLAPALSTENFLRAKTRTAHTGGGRYKGYLWLKDRWRAVEFAGLVGDLATYANGQEQPAAFERVSKQLAELAGTALTWRGGKFRRC